MKPKEQRGIALILALLSLLILSTLGTAVIFVTHAEIMTAKNFKQLAQARYAAEAGVQKGVNFFAFSYTPPSSTAGYTLTTSPVRHSGMPVILSATTSVTANYPDSSVQSAFSSALGNQSLNGMEVTATYSVYATLLRMRPFTAAFGGGGGVLETWQITSTGIVNGDRPARVEVVQVIERTSTPLFTYGIYATAASCGSITAGGNLTVDSYDSSLGNYATTRQNSNGNIGTGGNFNMGNTNSTVYGSLDTPYGNTMGFTCGAPMNAAYGAGALTASAGLQTITPPTLPNPTIPVTPTTSYTLSGTVPPGTYGNATGSGTVRFRAGTYNFNSICAISNLTFVVTSGPVIVNIGGNVPLGTRCSTGPSSPLTFRNITVNNGGTPSNFQIAYAGTGRFHFQNPATIYALMYLPNGRLALHANANWYGAAIANTILYQSDANIHYDRSIQNGFGVPGLFRPISFNWSKY